MVGSIVFGDFILQRLTSTRLSMWPRLGLRFPPPCHATALCCVLLLYERVSGLTSVAKMGVYHEV